MVTALTAPSTIPDGTVVAKPLYGTLLDAALVVDSTDGHIGGGFEYETDYCGPAHTVAADCSPRSTVGGITGSFTAGRLLTLTLTGVPAGAYPLTVSWGDGGQSTILTGTSATHTYAADGTYTVTVSGSQGYRASGPVVIAAATPGAIAPMTPTSLAQKTADDGVGWAIGYPFGVYHLSTCRSVGSIATAHDRAVRSLTLGEARAVEQSFQALLDAVPPVALAAAAHPVDALGALEQYAATVYGGVPVIHMPRHYAIVLAALGAIVRDGARLTTVLGTPVAAGGGYTGSKMYVTGAVLLERTPPQVIGPLLQQSTNQISTLVERLYAGSWECFVASIAVSGGFCCGGTVQGDPQADPTSGPGVLTGTDEIVGPETWVAPAAGSLRSVTVLVTNGTATVNGADVTAPGTVQFDADTGEVLVAPSISVDDPSDRAVVSWVVTT